MEYLKPFIIGGSIIAGAKYLSDISSPSFAPIIGGIPTGIIVLFFLSGQNEKREYLAGYLYSSILLSITIISINYIIINNKQWNVEIISIIAFFLWGILSFFIIEYFIPNKSKR